MLLLSVPLPHCYYTILCMHIHSYIYLYIYTHVCTCVFEYQTWCRHLQALDFRRNTTSAGWGLQNLILQESWWQQVSRSYFHPDIDMADDIYEWIWMNMIEFSRFMTGIDYRSIFLWNQNQTSWMNIAGSPVWGEGVIFMDEFVEILNTPTMWPG